MIFVTLGTQDKSFKRVLDILDKAIKEEIIKEEVIVQLGFTKYESENMKLFSYCNTDDFNNYIRNCDLLITHGGVGSIFTGLENDKKVMAIARVKKYKEHTNDHQLDIVESFTEEGYILSFNDYDSFVRSYNEVSDFKPKKYKSNTLNMINLIKGFIDK